MATNQQDTKITTTQNNMENHRSLKRTLLQAETKKNSQKQRITYSDSKQNSKELSDLLPSANMRNQISNIHNTTRRFNTHTQENLKEHLTVHSKSQKPDSHRKKQPNLTIFTHREDMPWNTQGRNTSSAASTCSAKHARCAEAIKNRKIKTRPARTKVNSLTNPTES